MRDRYRTHPSLRYWPGDGHELALLSIVDCTRYRAECVAASLARVQVESISMAYVQQRAMAPCGGLTQRLDIPLHAQPGPQGLLSFQQAGACQPSFRRCCAPVAALRAGKRSGGQQLRPSQPAHTLAPTTVPFWVKVSPDLAERPVLMWSPSSTEEWSADACMPVPQAGVLALFHPS